jgi:hypothetical protein
VTPAAVLLSDFASLDGCFGVIFFSAISVPFRLRSGPPSGPSPMHRSFHRRGDMAVSGVTGSCVSFVNPTM